ncbi:MAG: TonB-dependent receptor [bacterium]
MSYRKPHDNNGVVKLVSCVSFLFSPQLILLLVFTTASFAQTTGKIAGKITDAKTGEPLVGVNVIIEGTSRGAATDLNGDFYILNIPPGSYKLRVTAIGYETVHVQNLGVSVNRTSFVDVKMKEAIIEGAEVVVTADEIATKKDQTNSIRNVSSEQIEALPVENIDAVVNLQAGVVAGHIRGGRLDEVAYLVDGLQVDESFGRERAVTVEKEVVSEVEIITGTFNAEYGNAMSGIVNAVTKDGSKTFHATISGYAANHYTSHKDIFIGLKNDDPFRSQDYKMLLEGPVVGDRLTFLLNGRYQDFNGHLNGIRRFEPDNKSDFNNPDSSQWYSEHTGDNAMVPMNTSKLYSAFAKLSYKPLASLRTSLTYTLNDAESKWYSHWMKYNPDGRSSNYDRSHMFAAQLNHTLSQSLFYELKASYVYDFTGSYVFENPNDERYLHDVYSNSTGPGFSTGGQDKGYLKRTSQDYNAKYDITWQVNKHNTLKNGMSYVQHDIDQFSAFIRNAYFGTTEELQFVYDSLAQKRVYLYYEPIILPNSVYSDIYRVKPREFSAYLQDKLEYDYMVINVGLRYDWFDPNTRYPSQLRNPANQLSFPDNPEFTSTYPRAPSHAQLSPRFGLSYQLGGAALLRFSYGHFFQMPPLYALYTNYRLLVPPTNYGTTMGDPLLKPQKTIQYEVGLWQKLREGMSLEVAVYYRDIYELLSTRIITTFNQIRYGLYSNKDYGNAKGLELKFDYGSGPFFANLNYTLQYTRGNADNPTFGFTRAGANMDPVNVLIPMSWDQRHTLNASVGYHTANYGATVTSYFNSGTPYTWQPLEESHLFRVNLLANNAPKPAQVSVDLAAFYTLLSAGDLKLRLSLLGYNLLDTMNEAVVYGHTGRAYTDVIREVRVATHRSNFNEYSDIIQDPSMFGAPRSVKLGLEVAF